MRVAISHWMFGGVGGAEVYVGLVVSELRRRGHEVSLLSRYKVPASIEALQIPSDVCSWITSELGIQGSLDELRKWRPDVVFTNSLLNDPEADGSLAQEFPSVLFEHNYLGTCISGNKMFSFPRATCCDRRFGWQCLIQYYMRRCGGLNPKTMWSDYASTSRTLRLMRGYDAVAVATQHMKRELIKHGIPSEIIHPVFCPVRSKIAEDEACESVERNRSVESLWRLLFAGRMTHLKGASLLLNALPLVSDRLKRPLRLVMIGDGPERSRLETTAANVRAEDPLLNIEFRGWQQPKQVHRAMAESDLVVVPSLWPEPFGLVGPEAAQYGVPAVAFAVGGIPEWLEDGVNGRLAFPRHATAEALADSIVACLGDRKEYLRLRQGASELGRRFTPERHVDALLDIFGQVVAKGPQKTA